MLGDAGARQNPHVSSATSKERELEARAARLVREIDIAAEVGTVGFDFARGAVVDSQTTSLRQVTYRWPRRC